MNLNLTPRPTRHESIDVLRRNDVKTFPKIKRRQGKVCKNFVTKNLISKHLLLDSNLSLKLRLMLDPTCKKEACKTKFGENLGFEN